MAFAGTLTTENLGIERLVANDQQPLPAVRAGLRAGGGTADRPPPWRQPARLAANGTDQKARIIAAPDRRPRRRNLTPAQITHFRAHVEVVDLIGTRDPGAILAAARSCAARDPGPAPAPPGGLAMPVQRAPPAGRTIADPGRVPGHPRGLRRGLLVIEHYRNYGLLTTVIEAGNAADGYVSVLGAGLVSRVDHAAYLGSELARASTAPATSKTPHPASHRLATPARSRPRHSPGHAARSSSQNDHACLLVVCSAAPVPPVSTRH